MIFIKLRERLAVCRTYDAPECLCLRYPTLARWANLCRTSGADAATGCTLSLAGNSARFLNLKSRGKSAALQIT
jgi:hypothetical protein